MPNILLVVKHAELDLHNLRLRERIARETATDEPPATVSRATLPGDTRRLRGIPAIGRGVAGHIPGTAPGHTH